MNRSQRISPFVARIRARVRRCAAAFAALAAALTIVACQGYYPTWHYAPQTEIHALHVATNGQPSSSDPDARIGAQLIGILRPENGGPRRIHARFDIDDCGRQEIVFKTAQTRATPNGGAPLAAAPDNADVTVAPGTHRSIELFFDLPDPSALSNQALEQLELSWTVEIAGAPHASKATFHRAEYVDPGPYYWYGGPMWYGPVYWNDPWYWNYGYPGRCGPGWH
jgi:hypothetical protein